ncbi:hypothetical protein BD413DRAFT_476776 [Trametes elegans]|nr:hypothetical protein BD413DRAFT_476776 [Trametes elegans]
MRPIISYDDIVAPEPAPQAPKAQMDPPPAPPPTKKRKPNPHQQRSGGGGGGARTHQSVQHWDDPGSQEPQMSYDDAPAASASAAGRAGGAKYYEEEEEEEEEESRELTHEEIWDDSALIDAWNSAAAEYEAFHGPGKKWKEQPVKKSPLWYNVPPAKSSKPKVNTSAPAQSNVPPVAANGTADEDSAPLNFDTFVPTHDPSLAAAGPSHAGSAASALAVGAEAATASQDEAFSRAMTAMYWSGYWTAVYHCRRNEMQQTGAAAVVGGEEYQADGADEARDDEDEEMLPAQR